MGMLLREDDVHIPDFVNLFNARFAPVQQAKSNPGQPPAGMWHSPGDHDPEEESLYGGIAEMAALQSEFKIFQPKRPFWKSAALLGLGGVTNHRAKNRWLALLRWAGTQPSDKPGETGDERIVNALIANFAKDKPLPCYMTGHDLRDGGRDYVIVRENDKPLFYFGDEEFLTISLPMAPKPPASSAPTSPPPPPPSPSPSTPSPDSATPARRPARKKAASPATGEPSGDVSPGRPAATAKRPSRPPRSKS